MALGLLVAATALASGTGTSAGDQQYVDPLSTSTAKTTTHASTTPATPSAPATSPSSSAASSGTTTSTSPASTLSSPSAAHASSGTLPYTGLDIGACVAVGVGLLGAGLLLRRTVARA